MKDIEKEIEDLKARCIANKFIIYLVIAVFAFLWGKYMTNPKTKHCEYCTSYHHFGNADGRGFDVAPNISDSIAKTVVPASVHQTK